MNDTGPTAPVPRRPAPPKVGVCILRVEQYDGYVLITVTINRLPAPGLAVVTPERSEQFASPRDALRMAEQFLETFQ